MSGTDTAIAELSEPAADPTARTHRAAQRGRAVPHGCQRAPTPSPGMSTRWARTIIGEPFMMDDGRVGHAELALAGGVFYLADEYPEIGLKAPEPQAISVSLMIEVPTPMPHSTVRSEKEHGESGAREDHGSRERHHHRPVRPPLDAQRSRHRGDALPIQHGDVGYVSVWTPDADRAAAFYGHVLGWEFDPITHQVTNTEQHIGIFSVTSNRECCAATR